MAAAACARSCPFLARAHTPHTAGRCGHEVRRNLPCQDMRSHAIRCSSHAHHSQHTIQQLLAAGQTRTQWLGTNKNLTIQMLDD